MHTRHSDDTHVDDADLVPAAVSSPPPAHQHLLVHSDLVQIAATPALQPAYSPCDDCCNSLGQVQTREAVLCWYRGRANAISNVNSVMIMNHRLKMIIIRTVMLRVEPLPICRYNIMLTVISLRRQLESGSYCDWTLNRTSICRVTWRVTNAIVPRTMWHFQRPQFLNVSGRLDATAYSALSIGRLNSTAQVLACTDWLAIDTGTV